MYWVQFVYVQEKTETLSKEEHMLPRLHLRKKDTVPETVLRKKKEKNYFKKSFILHRSSSQHISLLLPFEA